MFKQEREGVLEMGEKGAFAPSRMAGTLDGDTAANAIVASFTGAATAAWGTAAAAAASAAVTRSLSPAAAGRPVDVASVGTIAPSPRPPHPDVTADSAIAGSGCHRHFCIQGAQRTVAENGDVYGGATAAAAGSSKPYEPLQGLPPTVSPRPG